MHACKTRTWSGFPNLKMCYLTTNQRKAGCSFRESSFSSCAVKELVADESSAVCLQH